MNLKQRIDQIIPQQSAAGFVIRNPLPVLNSVILQMVYFAYLHSIIIFGDIFGGKFK